MPHCKYSSADGHVHVQAVLSETQAELAATKEALAAAQASQSAGHAVGALAVPPASLPPADDGVRGHQAAVGVLDASLVCSIRTCVDAMSGSDRCLILHTVNASRTHACI